MIFAPSPFFILIKPCNVALLTLLFNSSLTRYLYQVSYDNKKNILGFHQLTCQSPDVFLYLHIPIVRQQTYLYTYYSLCVLPGVSERIWAYLLFAWRWTCYNVLGQQLWMDMWKICTDLLLLEVKVPEIPQSNIQWAQDWDNVSTLYPYYISSHSNMQHNQDGAHKQSCNTHCGIHSFTHFQLCFHPAWITCA